MIHLDFDETLYNIYYIVVVSYYKGQRLVGVILGLYLIYSHGEDLLRWATVPPNAQFPIDEAAHILAGLLLIKLSYYLRYWPSLRDYMRWQNRLIHLR